MNFFFIKQLKFGASLLESVQSGKLSQFALTPEGTIWMSRAIVAYWLKRWDSLYNLIVENIHADPEGKIGKQVAAEWTGLIDDYFSVGSRAFMTGVIMWQEMARQNEALKAFKTAPSLQDMAKQCHIQLLFNPEAATWISRALEVHVKS